MSCKVTKHVLHCNKTCPVLCSATPATLFSSKVRVTIYDTGHFMLVSQSHCLWHRPLYVSQSESLFMTQTIVINVRKSVTVYDTDHCNQCSKASHCLWHRPLYVQPKSVVIYDTGPIYPRTDVSMHKYIHSLREFYRCVFITNDGISTHVTSREPVWPSGRR